MLDEKRVHPGSEQLGAFGLGQLASAEAEEVEQHVNSCTVCCQTLWSLPDDRLVSLLRQTFSKPPASEVTSAMPSDSPQGANLPPELAEHPRYRIVEVLGQGGMGTVYKAQHRLMERVVALKVIDRSLIGNPAGIERFRREVKAAAQLNHTNIVHAYDAEQAGDSHFLVMEHVEGTTLARLVEQQGPLSVIQACDYVRQAALGLQRAFENGMIHRDIKPHNLMRTPQGVVKILDFGLARLMSETSPPASMPAKDADAAPNHLTQTGMVMGTVDYMAPEQAEDAHAADIRADIYSLGCTLYYLLSGRAPFPEGAILDKLKAHRSKKPRPLSDFRKDVPPGLIRVLERMTAKDPAQRYQTPAEAAEALLPFVASRRPRRLRYTAAALLLTAALTAAIIFIRTDHGELVIETDDPEIAVLIEQAGVKIRDRSGKREYLLKAGDQRLSSGEYSINVSELPEGIELNTPQFQLRRGDKVTVIARHRSSRPRPEKVFPGMVLLTGSQLPRFFNDSDIPITEDGVTPSAFKGSWRIESKKPRTVRLFEIGQPFAQDCQVIYKAQLKSQDLKGKAYLEMLCHFPDGREYFSKDLLHPLSGTMNWASYQTPFFLKKGERPDLIKLNLVIEGEGTVWIKDVSVDKKPLPR